LNILSILFSIIGVLANCIPFEFIPIGETGFAGDVLDESIGLLMEYRDGKDIIGLKGGRGIGTIISLFIIGVMLG